MKMFASTKTALPGGISVNAIDILFEDGPEGLRRHPERAFGLLDDGWTRTAAGNVAGEGFPDHVVDAAALTARDVLRPLIERRIDRRADLPLHPRSPHAQPYMGDV